MIEKKSSKGNLDKRRSTFLLLGFIMILGVVYVCFELFATKPKDLGTLPPIIITEPTVITPITDPTKPPPPVTQGDIKIEIIENAKRVIDELPPLYEYDPDEEIPPYEPIPLPDEKPEDAPPPFFVDEMPEPMGGIDALYAFLKSNLRYPQIARDNGIQGQVLVGFVIERDGSISNVKVDASVFPDLDQEAIRVVKLMPNWKPGKQGGKTVRCSYQLPIRFILN
jgi:protein TonB